MPERTWEQRGRADLLAAHSDLLERDQSFEWDDVFRWAAGDEYQEHLFREFPGLVMARHPKLHIPGNERMKDTLARLRQEYFVRGA